MSATHNTTDGAKGTRNTVFISKATPEDDDFVLWLAPRLEAASVALKGRLGPSSTAKTSVASK